MAQNGFDHRLKPWLAIPVVRSEGSFEKRLEPAALLKKQLDRVHSWREGLPPQLRRACSAGQLLFQVVGAAGYAGYFASMHTFMRLFSGALMAGAWYMIYRIKGTAQPGPVD